MSFFTSLTGLRAANTELAVTSNNIANVGTTGFKKSQASFGDIFASSPLQNSAGTVGQGVAVTGIRQEFSQGSIEFSSNTLDLAISGDGFFPLKSADGQTDIFSRSGAFVLNEQGNVVNSSGQTLMVSAVDGIGNAVGDRLETLTIPPATIGDAKQTSLVELSLNLPADAPVITAAFDPNDATTYNKSTAVDVYDAGGTAYSATIYYVKTANPEANIEGGSTYNDLVNQPSSKWQTYVVIDGQILEPKLQQAQNDQGEPLYVNQYGEIKPFNEIAGELQPGKTPKFTFDDLSDVQESQPATVEGAATPNPLGLGQGFNFLQDLAAAVPTFTPAQLANIATVDIDNSGNPVTLDLSALTLQDQDFTGVELAAFMQTQLNSKFGDDRFFDLSAPANREFVLNHTQGAVQTAVPIDLGQAFVAPEQQLEVTKEQLITAIQAQIDGALGAGVVTVSYDDVARNFAYTPTDPTDVLSLQAGANGNNQLFGLTTIATPINDDGVDSTGATV
ncbi:MAG: flagellar hook-basal body complex protein, partial [Pseudomonadota bacterium]|nr:flagellar hook-basal body complex protein [Pseudomonadota bacterium]